VGERHAYLKGFADARPGIEDPPPYSADSE
jgi:hypothetical protein